MSDIWPLSNWDVEIKGDLDENTGMTLTFPIRNSTEADMQVLHEFFKKHGLRHTIKGLARPVEVKFEY